MKNSNRFSRLQLFAVVVGMFYSFTAQASNLLINGGFEQPLVTAGYVYEHRNGNELPGWTLFSTYKGTVQFDTSYDPVSEGFQAVQIEVPGDWISQSFATEVGQSYSVSFDLSAYSVYGGPGLGYTPCSPFCASILGVTVGPVSTTFNGSSAGYATNTLQFVAESSITTLKFLNVGEIDVWGNYPHLDNVIVSGPAPVPLPATFWLLGSGLIGLLGILRRS